jgi:hypothetical protein
MALESSILNFLTMSLVYFAWCTNVASFVCLIWSLRRTATHPSCSSRIPCSCVTQSLQPNSETSRQR